MRDLVLLSALVAFVPLILRAPFMGVLLWLWITLMNPQREVYSLLADFPLNFYVAAFTAAAWAFSRERKVPPIDGFVVFLLLFAAWASICTVAGLDRTFSLPLWERTMKTMILVLVVVAMANSAARIQALLWVVVASLGFYAIKGGGFVLLTGGAHRVYGPQNTMIADNNSLGLALVVLLPVMGYLLVTSRQLIARLALLASMALTLVAILGTYSRGALLALTALIAFQAIRSRTGLALLAAGSLAVVVLPSVAPTAWLERMSTLRTFDEDASFQGRQAAWRTSLNIAAERPLIGGGFSVVERDAVVKQFKTPDSLDFGKAAHSIYFEVLGDTGWVGLGLYVAMLLSAGFNTASVLRAARGHPELAWARLLARLLQCSLLAILIGGAALSVAYYDGFLVLLALTTCLRTIVYRQLRPATQVRLSAPDFDMAPGPLTPWPASVGRVGGRVL